MLPYTARQMYDLVADVANYPKFLPWTAAARVRSIDDQGEKQVMLADLVISFKVFRETFLSRVTLWPEARRIETTYIDGPFKKMDSVWSFAQAPGGCEVTFATDFEFKNRILQAVIGAVFNEAMQRIVRAFEMRAAALYGPAA